MLTPLGGGYSLSACSHMGVGPHRFVFLIALSPSFEGIGGCVEISKITTPTNSIVIFSALGDLNQAFVMRQCSIARHGGLSRGIVPGVHKGPLMAVWRVPGKTYMLRGGCFY